MTHICYVADDPDDSEKGHYRPCPATACQADLLLELNRELVEELRQRRACLVGARDDIERITKAGVQDGGLWIRSVAEARLPLLDGAIDETDKALTAAGGLTPPESEREIALRMGLDPDAFPPGALLAGLPKRRTAESSPEEDRNVPAPSDKLRGAIMTERDTRHWTIDQWRRTFGDDWPRKSAEIRSAADDATDALLSSIASRGRGVGGHALGCPQNCETVNSAACTCGVTAANIEAAEQRKARAE